MLIYLAKPIDKVEGSLNSDRLRKGTNAITEYLYSGREDVVLYDPQTAFRMGRDAKPTGQVNQINYGAIAAADQMLVLWPKGVKSWGVPAEVHEAMRENLPVTIVVQEDTTWAMQYANLNVVRAKSENIEHWVEAVRTAAASIISPKRTFGELIVDGSIDSIDISKLSAPTPREIRLIVADALGVPRCASPSCRIHGSEALDNESEALKDPSDILTSWNEAPAGSSLTSEGKITTKVRVEDAKVTMTPPGAGTTLPVLAMDVDGWFRKPSRGHEDDAGLDLYVSSDVVIQPGQFLDVPTNTAVKLPEGTWGFLVGRSSTLRSKGLLVNPGVIDVGYTGELYCAVWNLGTQAVYLNRGDRVSQLIILPNGTLGQNPVRVAEFEGETARGTKGFGSTGA